MKWWHPVASALVTAIAGAIERYFKFVEDAAAAAQSQAAYNALLKVLESQLQ